MVDDNEIESMNAFLSLTKEYIESFGFQLMFKKKYWKNSIN